MILNVGAQNDELTALEAIYGDDCLVDRDEHCVEVTGNIAEGLCAYMCVCMYSFIALRVGIL